VRNRATDAHSPFDTLTQDLEWTLKSTYQRSGRARGAVAAKQIQSKLIRNSADTAGVFTLRRHQIADWKPSPEWPTSNANCGFRNPIRRQNLEPIGRNKFTLWVEPNLLNDWPRCLLFSTTIDQCNEYRPSTFSITPWYHVRARQHYSRVLLWYADLNRN
jgi:hypothetical protein